MADITLDTHYACNIIAILVNVIGIKYRFVLWIKLDHSQRIPQFLSRDKASSLYDMLTLIHSRKSVLFFSSLI